MQHSGLTFTVQAAPFKNTQKEASVAFAIELDGERLEFAPPNEKGQFANKIELSYFGLNEQGKAMAGTRTELDLTLRPETRDRVKTHGVRVNPRINLPPGRYQVRIGARDSVAGQTGSVYYDLDVPDFRKEKLMIGGFLMTTPSVQQTPSIQPDPIAAKTLPAPATSRRAFPQSDTVVLYTEIYDNVTAKQPRRIDVAVRLMSETGTEVFASRDELSNGLASLGTTGAQGGNPWDIYGYAKQIPLKERTAWALLVTRRSAVPRQR